MREYRPANNQYYLHKVGDEPDMVHPVACFQGPLGHTPMLFEQEDANHAAILLNKVFGRMNVSFVARKLHVDGGPRQRTLKVTGHPDCNHIYLRDPGLRRPEGPDDWGDDMTINCHLETRDGHRLYGSTTAVFTGKLANSYVIGIKNVMEQIVTEVFYPSLKQAQKDWILD